MALLYVCFGLRISKALAAKWQDIDWLNGGLRVERGIVCQIVDDVKIPKSQRSPIANEMLDLLEHRKRTSQSCGLEDWVFASPVQLGRLPWSYDQAWRVYRQVAGSAGIGGLGTHALRHTYRSWLDAVGTPVAVQQKLMRHADIRTTMNMYGEVVTDEMAQARGKVLRLVLSKGN
jgi:integrase